MAAVLLFHFLPGLPEEQVGADRRPEDRDQRHRVVLVEVEGRDQGVADRFAPRHMTDEHHRDIGKQRQRGPLEDAGVARVAHPHLEHDAGQPEQRGEQQHRPGHDQSQNRAHRAEVGAEVDHVGDQQQHHHRTQQPWRVMLAQVLRDALASGRADPGADRLDRGEQRKAKEHRPGHAIAKLRADLAIGADPRGIVVGGAGNQPGAKHFQRIAAFGLGHGVLSLLIAAWTSVSASARGRPGAIGGKIRYVITPARFHSR